MATTPARVAAAAFGVVLGLGCGGGSKSAPACTDPLMIDDMEDGDRFICESAGRHGDWYTVSDGTSTNISPSGDFTQGLIPAGRDGSRSAAHLTGFGFTDWGAGMGFSLNGEGAAAQPYDASAAGGIAFWMKSNVNVYAKLLLPQTISAGMPAGACVDAPDQPNCDNHFYVGAAATPLDEWVEYHLPFAQASQLARQSGGDFLPGTAVWNASQLVSIRFDVQPRQTFDVWIDDARFYSCTGDECLPTCPNPKRPLPCPASAHARATCRPAGIDCARTITADLLGVWGRARDDVWVAGKQSTLLHWNGTSLAPVAGGATADFFAVWGSGPADVWAVGTGGTIVHFDGMAFAPVASGTSHMLMDVWGSAPDDVWAVGSSGTVLHWDGNAWSPVAAPAYGLRRVWGTAANDVWAVGGSVTAGPAGVLHWDGAAWSVDPNAAPAHASGLWGSGPDDVWVVGSPSSSLHWDGARWAAAPSGTSQVLTGLGGSGRDDAWAVSFEGTVVHWNGAGWSTVASPGEFFLSAWAGSRDDAWIVGGSGTVAHWDGAAWSIVPVDVQ